MKKTKRSLLIGIAAMGLVAASAGAVSTFAWYSATNNATVKSSTANGTLQADDPEYSVGTPLPLLVEVTRVDAKNTANLELGHWAAANELSSAKGVDGNAIGTHSAGFYHAFYDKDDVLHYTTSQLDGDLAAFATYKINIKAAITHTDDNGVIWSQDEIAAALSGKTVSVKVARNGGRAMFYGASTSAAGTALPSAAGESGEYTVAASITLAEATIKSSGAGHDCWFSLYVEGADGGTADTTSVSGNFTVTVA